MAEAASFMAVCSRNDIHLCDCSSGPLIVGGGGGGVRGRESCLSTDRSKHKRYVGSSWVSIRDRVLRDRPTFVM
jgi:hypothetical protein